MDTTRYSLLTPKEGAKIALNSAFTHSIEKCMLAFKKKHEYACAVEESPNTGDPCHPAIHNEGAVSSSVEQASPISGTHWHSSDFYVSMLNFSLGYGTVLGFPRLCYKHGGGIFLFPYLVMLFFEAIPLVCVEIAIGQHFQNEFLLQTWRKVHPSAVGLGISAVFISLFTIVYFNVIVGWCAAYLFSSLQRHLPWASCPDHAKACTNMSSPSEYYWYETQLDVSVDINSVKGLNWEMYLFVFISWILVFMYNVKGIKFAAKPGHVILVIAVVLYIALFLMVVHLDEWARGLALFFDFDMKDIDKLLSIEIWHDAANHAFFTLGIGYGSILMYSSHNDKHFQCKSAALYYGLIDTTIGVCSCIIVFSLRGFQAHFKDKECLKFLEDNNRSWSDIGNETKRNLFCNYSFLLQPLPDAFSLAFISWSESFTRIPYPPLWSSFSYFLLLLTGIGSMSGMVLNVVYFLREVSDMKHIYATGLVCSFSCVFGLLFTTDNGLYMVNLFHGYCFYALPWIALMEILTVFFLFGRKNFCKIFEEMTGERLHVLWIVCWFFITPAILVTLIILSVVDLAKTDGYKYSVWKSFKGMTDIFYPSWCYVIIGLSFAIPVVSVIGVFFIYCIRHRHLLMEMFHDTWKYIWHRCRRQEEFELENVAEGEDCRIGSARGRQILPCNDAVIPKLLSFDNMAVENGNALIENVEITQQPNCSMAQSLPN